MRPASIVALIVAVIAGIYATWTLTRNTTPPGAPPAQADRLANFVRIDPPESAPDLTVTGPDGTATRLKNFAGQVVLVNFWATWCAPCRAEMPSLDRLEARLGGDRFRVVPISLDRAGMPRVQAFLKENGIRNLIPYLDAESRSLPAFGLPGLPTTIVLDAQGRLIGRLIGPAEWDSPSAIALLAGLSGATPRPGK